MSTNVDQQTEIDRPASSGAFLERMANRVGINSKVTAVFGDPVERDSVTVIPVAKVWWGFGGGAGAGRDASQTQTGEGTGGGGGSRVVPIGYIELRDGTARFRPIYDPGTVLSMVIGVGLITMFVLRSIRKLVR
jgi:uncharacterized spore protein YtfJ